VTTRYHILCRKIHLRNPAADDRSDGGCEHRHYGYHALASGGIGWGLPASVGVSIANPDRPVVCYSGDGSAMYSIQALWTAAHHKLPLTMVIVNNGGYRIIKQRLLSFHGDSNYVGMDFLDPPLDFAGIGKSLGLEAMRITDPASGNRSLSRRSSGLVRS
jgi:benzoylformate decarboxylase